MGDMDGYTDEVTQYVTTSDGLQLAVYESGQEDAPVVVLVHGYPDNHHVWDGVAAELADEFHVVQYDVRGAGYSDAPVATSSYKIDQLVDDLGRVIDAVSPESPVHLVAHDWGSIQCWDALPDDRLGVRIRSFTSISGPSLDHASMWLRALHRGPVRRILQMVESYYIGFFMTPVLPEFCARRGIIARAVEHSSSLGRPSTRRIGEKVERGEEEAVNGIALYRANMPGRLLRPRPPHVTLPVQVITPSHDVHVSAALASEAPQGYAANLVVHRIRGNHWVVAQRPAAIATLVRAFVDQVTPELHGAPDDSDFPR
jgi:pimeloyl-ACP methyl ester carboxylesterase